MTAVAPREVIILNDYASFNGGSSCVALNSAVGLAGRGFKVTLFTCVGPVAPQLHEVPNLDVVCLDQPEIAKDSNRWRAGVNGWCNFAALRALRALLAKKSSADTVVHAHTWTKALSPFALHLVAKQGFPLVVTLHDFFLACPNGGLFNYRTHEVCHRRPLSVACITCDCDRRRYAHKLWRTARTWTQNQLLQLPRQASCFIAVSAFSRDLLQPHLPPETPAYVVRNPVEMPYVAPACVAENREFVFVGRFETEKGAGLFAEAAQQAQVPATFVGDGALLAQIRHRAPKAKLTGWLSGSALRQQVSSARALVFPPLWYETLGLVVIEAAAAGIPAIVADHCAAAEYVRHGVNGLHFKHGSSESLSEQMQRLASDNSLARALGVAAHDWYWDDPWTLERHVSELTEIYGRIVKNQTNLIERKVA
jgi:glycosyltransferase involved in cell wall biosynthesis